MDLQQLRNFKAVAELENISRAAERLYMSQPNLSTSLKRLESDMDLPLLLRRRGKVSLTPCGRIFYDYVNRSLEELDAGIAAARRAYGGNRGTIRVAAPLADLTAEVLQGFLLKNPTTGLKQYNYVNQYCLNALMDATADIAVVFGPVDDPEIKFIPIDTCRRVMLVARNHPLAEEYQVSVEQLGRENCICNVGRGDERLYAYLEQRGIKTRVVCECDSDMLETNMLSSGYGVSVSPILNYIKLKTNYPQLQISMVLLTGGVPDVTLGFAMHRDHILTDEEQLLLQLLNGVFSGETAKLEAFLKHYEKDPTI